MYEFLDKTEPIYFYVVTEYVTTFQMDDGKNEPYSHVTKFEGNNLMDCKYQAEQYYYERLNGLEKGKYFLPYATPQDFELGKNAAFSITLSFVEYYTDNEYFEHTLIGEDEETTSESKEIETAVLTEKDYL